MDHSMRGVLSVFGDLLGLTFQESPPGDQSRQVPIATYLKFQNLTEHNSALDLFWVFDITGNTPKCLGTLILDVGERVGKPREVHCTTFGSVRNFIFFAFPLLFSVFLAKNCLIDFKSSFHLKIKVDESAWCRDCWPIYQPNLKISICFQPCRSNDFCSRVGSRHS